MSEHNRRKALTHHGLCPVMLSKNLVDSEGTTGPLNCKDSKVSSHAQQRNAFGLGSSS